MPREVDQTFKQEKAKQENAPIFLYTLEAYDGVNDLRLASFDQDITYDGVLYSKFPITHEFISENNQGQIEQVKVRHGNVSRLIELYLEQYDFRGKKVTIRMVWADQLSDPDAHMDDVFYIDNYSSVPCLINHIKCYDRGQSVLQHLHRHDNVSFKGGRVCDHDRAVRLTEQNKISRHFFVLTRRQ